MIIAISGKKQSGKNTVADMIEDIFREQSQKGLVHVSTNSFAKSLKKIVSMMLGMDLSDLEHEGFKNAILKEQYWIKNGKEVIQTTPRILMEYIGTTLFREQWNEDIWVTKLMKDYERLKAECSYNKTPFIFIISDLRFKNEIEIIRKVEKDCLFIRVEREGIERRDTKPEIDLDDYQNWDCVIKNNSTKIELRKQVENFIKTKQDDSSNSLYKQSK